nr:MAG TPA: minor structural protein [Caudoviricetes sp.]
MATILTSSQQTFVDITDQRKLSAYITSNLPKTQSEDPNTLPHAYAPSWETSHLVLTPVIFLDQTNVALDASGLTISWKRKDGTGAESALTTGESVSKGVLTVSQNKLADSTSGMITYICYISYYDSETKNTVNISSDITYTLVKNAENAKLAYVTADTYVFKYNTSSALVGATQATLTAQVQGVAVSKWQYLNASGVWTDYPTTSDNTSITGGTLVVKPAHAVFFNNVAQIKLVTDDVDVFDTISITKMYDGEQGQPGQAGSGGLSIILGNEAQTIACTTGGAVQTALEVTIPFTGYVGITQTACSCTVGTLPTGVTVTSNTAATASASGSVVLAFAANATLGGASVLNGTIDLTFTISGKTVVKKFAWTKSNRGSNGASAVVFSIYAPDGTVVLNQSGSLVLATSAYSGAAEITTGATYQWAEYTGGKWTDISGATSDSLTVSGSDIVNIQSYRCTMTYGGKSYVDVITVEDKSDPYVSEMLSIGGFTVKNSLGGLVPYVIVRTNQKEVDALLGSISETAPSAPASGAFWYKIDHSAKTVTLMKYNGTEWAAATETQSLTYTWYKQDKDGKETEFDKTGKVIYLSAEDIDSIATLQCDVSN